MSSSEIGLHFLQNKLVVALQVVKLAKRERKNETVRRERVDERERERDAEILEIEKRLKEERLVKIIKT